MRRGMFLLLFDLHVGILTTLLKVSPRGTYLLYWARFFLGAGLCSKVWELHWNHERMNPQFWIFCLLQLCANFKLVLFWLVLSLHHHPHHRTHVHHCHYRSWSNGHITGTIREFDCKRVNFPDSSNESDNEDDTDESDDGGDDEGWVSEHQSKKCKVEVCTQPECGGRTYRIVDFFNRGYCVVTIMTLLIRPAPR